MKTFTALSLVYWATIYSFSSADEPSVKLKAVTADLYTKWTQTPLIVEASEFFYDENPALFWSFLEKLQLLLGSFENAEWTEKEQYDYAVSIGDVLLSPIKQNFFKLALTLRYYSARIQMYRQLLDSENITLECKDVLIDLGGGSHVCGLQALEKALKSDSSQDIEKANLLSIDHHHPGSGASSRVLIVYGNILRPEFWRVHEFLLSSRLYSTYVFRHYTDPREAGKLGRVRIPGYGVEMAIKSTEYKAQDDSKIGEGEGKSKSFSADEELNEELDTDIHGFNFGKLKANFHEKKEQLEQFKSFLLQSTGTELQALKAWQYQDLSLQAAEKFLRVAKLHLGSASDALRTLRDVSQNFPTQATTLLRLSVQEEVKGEIERNREFFAHYHNIESGGAALFINGIQFDTDLVDVYSLFDKLREENRLMESLHGLGIRGPDLTAILELDLKPSSSAKYGVDIRHPAVNWVNDLEKDKRYAEWSSSVRELIRQSFPPTLLKAVRRNFYNLVLVVNPANAEESGDILRLAESFLVHRLPIRIGIAFITNSDPEASGISDASVALFNAYRFISENKTPHNALSFLTDLYLKVASDNDLSTEKVIQLFKEKYPKEDSDAIFAAKSTYEDGKDAGRNFLSKLNIGEAPVALLNGVPLDRSKLNIDEFENEVLMEIVNVYSVLQRDVSSGDLTDYSNVIEHLMNKPSIVPRLNKQILEPTAARIISFSGKSLDPELYTFPNFEQLSSSDRTATMSSASFYLTKHEEEDSHPVTMWVVADPETAAGRDFMYSAVKHSKTSKNVRVGFVYNPIDIASLDGTGLQITKAIQVALETQPMQLARNYITKLLKEENVAEIEAGTKTFKDFEVNGMDMVAFASGLSQVSSDFLKIHSLYSQKELALQPGVNAIIANGYLVGPITEEFGADDFQLLERFIDSWGASKLRNELHKLHIFNSGEQLSDVVMMTSALLSGLGTDEETKKRTKIQYSETEHSVVNIDARDPDQPSFDVSFIVDPVSKEAQKITPILITLHETLNCRIRILLNCRDKLSELPLKSFYRFVLDSKLSFTTNGSISPNYAIAKFAALPQTALLTMNLQPPDNWLTEAKYAIHDLDNIRLEEVDGWGVHGDFQLENLLLEGSAKDQSNDQPPRGTQFILGTSQSPSMVDTIVMANLGYFQLKANPGAWSLKLREGRSREIYSIASSEGAERDGSDEEQLRVVLSSFSTNMIKIVVKKRPGMEKEDVLSDVKSGQEAGTGILDSISSYWSKEEKEKSESPEDMINIFSLASGHLYERFLRLMMLSVMKHTKTPVKFWFLKNYLSPQFKEFLPFMAQHYGFQFELVEYKWPRWLNRQSEKQRLIWGYKILFLDVLFPLSVKKIIFVDADQIVRTDMKELRDLNLDGAPYGYTPFCDSRTEMEGFRFWKNGYWASHLGYRKYHISALYVVDLVKFRKIAAGDRLRAQYQGLSQDPNSLSNLDQDLPNNMIYQVPIKSLPQEWLWCETWCDDASKAKAKTIDLCNNPQTKEPKLTAAMRIIPEWKSYDDEIRELLDRFLTEKKGLPPPLASFREPREPTEEELSENEISVHSDGSRDEL